MKYTVTWNPSVKNDLAHIWITATNRQAVADAADRIDRRLMHDPERQGEDFYGDQLLVENPLGIVFAVNPDDRQVRVIQVWHQ
jgi:hypothetical protein